MTAAAFAHCPFAVRSPSSPVVAWVAYYPTPLCLRVVVSPFGSLLLLLSLVLLIIPPLLDVGFYFWTLALFSYYRSEGRSVCALSFRRSDLFLFRRRSHGFLFRCRLVSVLCLGSPLGVLVMG